MSIGISWACAPVRAAVLAVVLGTSALLAQAQGFSNAAIVNRSAVDVLEQEAGILSYVFQARSATELRAPVQIDASTWRLEHRLAFAVGAELQYNNSAAWLSLGGTHDLAYDLSFTVNDPGRVGYTLTLDSLLAGVMRATTSGGSEVLLPAFVVSVDYGLGFVELADLGSNSHLLYEGSRVMSEQHRSVLGEFFGTRSFDLRVRTPNDDARAFTDTADEPKPSHLQFGLPLTSPLFNGGTYPAFDGSDASAHGHFLTVQAVFNTSPVPEPESWALLAAGLGVVALRWRRTAGSGGAAGAQA